MSASRSGRSATIKSWSEIEELARRVSAASNGLQERRAMSMHWVRTPQGQSRFHRAELGAPVWQHGGRRSPVRPGYHHRVKLPVMPPVSPMLAKLSRELPEGPDLFYEPKWDGFRCIVFRD